MHYTFADCTLDTQLYVLRRAGTPQHLRPKVFQVLQYLLQHRDRVISKQELAEQLWPAQYICDAVVENTIMAARRAVGDSGRVQGVIQTLPGYGYRFVAPVAEPLETAVSGETLAMAAGPGVLAASPAAAPLPGGTQGLVTHDGTLLQAAQRTLFSEAMQASRRQITVLCATLADAAALAQQQELEAHHNVIRAYQAVCTDVVQRFDGYIAQNSCTGMVVYFGYPHAHEDDAARAVQTGLDIVEALSALNTRLESEHGVRLRVRVGIHTGLVVTDDSGGDARPAQVALGATPHMAAQIQELAAPDTVVISIATARLIQGRFVCRDLEGQRHQDSTIPEPVVQVLQPSNARNRFEVAMRRGLRPLVGRAEEMRLLRQRWEQAQRGRGHGVLLCGEAGIGKSRLVAALREHVEGQAAPGMVFCCAPYVQQSTFSPVIDHLQRRLQWRRDTTPVTKLATLETLLRTADVPLEETVPLFAALLAVPLAAPYTPVHLTPERQKQQTLEAVTAWLLREAERQPRLVAWEDLHWADPSTLELLGCIIDQLPRASLLMVFTCRPEFQPPWPARSYLTQITLDRLDNAQVAQMVRHETAGKSLPAEVLQEVIAKSDGVPLFVEELLKMLLESGLLQEEANQYALSSPLPSLTIPSTLHDLLMARLDHLGPAREVAQLGTTLGREFTYEMLQAIAPMEEAALQQGLSQLVNAELLYQRGLSPHSSYLFKHALVQETAYQSLLKCTRQQYHQRIAQVLETQFPELSATQPELLAYHHAAAGDHVRAVDYWHTAGQRAISRSAYQEAIRHCTTGLAALAGLPETPERAQQEFALLRVLRQALVATQGHASQEVERVLRRGMELCRQLGDPVEILVCWLGAHLGFYHARGEFRTARTFAAQQLCLAQKQQEPGLLMRAHTNLGVVFFYLGQLDTAHAHLEQSLIPFP